MKEDETNSSKPSNIMNTSLKRRNVIIPKPTFSEVPNLITPERQKKLKILGTGRKFLNEIKHKRNRIPKLQQILDLIKTQCGSYSMFFQSLYHDLDPSHEARRSFETHLHLIDTKNNDEVHLIQEEA